MNAWSYSAYSAAVKCLQYYKLVYVDKLRSKELESGDLNFGSALHSSLNSCITGDEAPELVFEIYWDTYKDKEIKYGRYKWTELKELGLEFVRKFKNRHSTKYIFHSAESRLYNIYSGLALEGTPDFIGSYDGKRSIRDFKTSGYNYDRDKQEVALQLNLYAYLSIKELNFKPETLGYTVFNKGTGSIQDLTWDFDESKMYAMLEDLVKYCKMVDSQKNYTKNPNACIIGSMKCDMFNVCWPKKGTTNE